MFSKQNKAKILIFSPQICPRVDSNKKQNIFLQIQLKSHKNSNFRTFILKIMYKIEWILCFKKNLLKILIITPEMSELAN
jgi:hypothetical protein